MRRVSEQEVLEFIIYGGTNEWILLRESRQEFIEFVVMYETEIPCVNGMKYVQNKAIKLCEIF